MKTLTTIYKSRGQWRWRMKDRNGKIIGASTEAYRRLKDCRANLKRVTHAKALQAEGIRVGVFAVVLVYS